MILILRDKLVVNGLDIDGVHISFGIMTKKNELTRVLVSRLPMLEFLTRIYVQYLTVMEIFYLFNK